MPLMHGKSERAFGHNVSAEMEHGKPQKQALAIAYAVKRKAERKKMAHGGFMREEEEPEMFEDVEHLTGLRDEDDEAEGVEEYADGGDVDPQSSGYNIDPDKASAVSSSFKKALGYAGGGEIGASEGSKSGSKAATEGKHSTYNAMTGEYDSADDEGLERTPSGLTYLSEAHGGLIDRAMRRYSEGGMVANEQRAIAGSELNQYDDLANRDDLEFCYYGDTSGDEIGDAQEDDDRHDIVSRIMRSRRLGDSMPHTGMPGYGRGRRA